MNQNNKCGWPKYAQHLAFLCYWQISWRAHSLMLIGNTSYKKVFVLFSFKHLKLLLYFCITISTVRIEKVGTKCAFFAYILTHILSKMMHFWHILCLFIWCYVLVYTTKNAFCPYIYKETPLSLFFLSLFWDHRHVYGHPWACGPSARSRATSPRSRSQNNDNAFFTTNPTPSITGAYSRPANGSRPALFAGLEAARAKGWL